MAPKRPTTDGAGEERKERQSRAGTSASTKAQPPDRERRLVDVDPWAMLLEGLMETPEGEPAKRKRDKAG
jgi:hypothetical protein